ARERGLVGADEELSEERIFNLIFAPGFSTADVVSDVSGRGVGMDVVKRNINELGGHVQIHSSAGKGSTVRIRLPLTLAILDGQLMIVEADGQRVGLFVDELMSQQQVVIKSLEANFRPVVGLAGATMLGDGRVALILDIPGVMSRYQTQQTRRDPAQQAA